MVPENEISDPDFMSHPPSPPLGGVIRILSLTLVG